MKTTQDRIFSAVAAAGLVAMAILCLSGGPVRAQPAAGSVRGASQGAQSALAAQLEASAPDHGHGAGSDAGRIALVATAASAVGAFAVLQAIAWSRDRRSQAIPDEQLREKWQGTP